MVTNFEGAAESSFVTEMLINFIFICFFGGGVLSKPQEVTGDGQKSCIWHCLLKTPVLEKSCCAVALKP